MSNVRFRIRKDTRDPKFPWVVWLILNGDYQMPKLRYQTWPAAMTAVRMYFGEEVS